MSFLLITGLITVLWILPASQAEASANTRFLQQLIQGVQESGLTVSDFVKTEQQVYRNQNSLAFFASQYDYIYDLFLIDSTGNILFSIAHEDDLGTNLMSGPYAQTRFATAVQAMLQTGQTSFSDFEYYSPSDDELAAFLVAPLVDTEGNQQGALAIQLRLERIFNLFQQSLVGMHPVNHYLVGPDGRLRFPIRGDREKVLTRLIETYPVQEYRKMLQESHTATEYIDSDGKAVIGVHHAVEVLGVRWLLISEMDRAAVMQSTKWLGEVTLILVFLTTVLVLVVDNQINQLVACGILEEEGLQVDVAANGLEALACLQQAPDDAPYHLILMDCQMPEIDGYVASEKIRSGVAGDRYVKTPIIAMTANAMQGNREKCLAAGMDDYLAKPIDQEPLMAKMCQWLIPEGDQLSVDMINRESVASEAEEEKTVSEITVEEDIWDFDSALKRVLGKVERLQVLINLFLSDQPQRLNDLSAAIAQADIEQACHLAHTAKGVASNLSAITLQQAAAAVEQTLIDENMALASELLEPLLQSNQVFSERIERYLQSLSST